MEAGDVPDADDLVRLRDLCAGLAGELGNGQLLAWADASVPAAVPDVVFGLVSGAGLLAGNDPARRYPPRSVRQLQRQQISVPADADELWSRLWEVDELTAIELLLSLEASSVQDRSRRARRMRRYQGDPADMLSEVARRTGQGTRWWTNTDLTTWTPVTQHTFDALVVGAGNGLVVTLIAFEAG